MGTVRAPSAGVAPSAHEPMRPGGRDAEELARELAALTAGEVLFDAHSRMLYATDASIYQVEPIGVVTPRTVEEGERVMRHCAARGVPVLPRGGGTALAGQSVNRAVVVDFSRHCRQIISIDAARRRAVVEPGVVLDQLNRAAAPHGLRFGPDVATGSHATIGGMVGNNSSGANSILYGRTVDHVIALDVALPTGQTARLERGSCDRDPRQRAIAERLAAIVLPMAGEIDARYPRILRHVDGLNLDILLRQLRESTPGTFDAVNLAHLVCGSEGTLCTILRAEVALVPVPAAIGLAIVGFGGVPEALAPLGQMLATRPSAVELVDDVVIAMALRNTSHRSDVEIMPRPGGTLPGAVMYVQYFADGPSEIDARFAQLRDALPGAVIAEYRDGPSMERAWRLRKAGEPLLHAVPGHRKPVTFVEDTAVDPARLPAFVEEFRQIVARHGTTAAYYAHASVGCLHIRPLIALDDPKDLSAMVALSAEVADLVVRHEGALSGEHGDGRVRTPLLDRVLGPSVCEAIRRVKAVFDPQGVMNPGNLTQTSDPGRIVMSLRVRPDDAHFAHVPAGTETAFAYGPEGGFAHAVSSCNGAGLCRRLSPAGGTMCPSYRATLDERHSTRGRGNALRLAATGQFGADAGADGAAGRWNDPSTLETLGLCLSCKACKSECPSNVDIAKLKAEYLHQGHRARGGIDWRTRMLSGVRALSRLASAMQPVAGSFARTALARRLASAVMGFDARRSLPPVGASLFRWARRRRAAVNTSAPAVILFGDCFSAYGESDIGRSAVELLEAFGYRVVVADAGCCGRAAISCGALDDAARMIGRGAASLSALADGCGARAILLLEPSCHSALVDDWADLRTGADPAAIARIASMSHPVDVWLDAHWDAHPRRPQFSAAGEACDVHVHCHQKALLGTAGASGLLRRILGANVRTLETGCCGMAGAFGFDRERYDLSMRIGELGVLPAARALRAGSVMVAAGTSCRHQIRDGASVEALHPVQVAHKALVRDRSP
jgi:FAD/FMN-containing dehydrogenase/Fe-S oxidoreductase